MIYLKQGFQQLKTLKYLAPLLALFIFASCTTQRVKFEEYQKASWKARTLIRDKVKKKSQVVFSQIFAQRPDQLRIDMTTSLGIHVASIAMNSNTLSCLIPPQKLYVTGNNTKEVLERAVSISVSPTIIMNLLFDIEPKEPGWSCERDRKGLLMSCEKGEHLKILWANRELARKSVQIITPKAELQFDLSSFQPNVELNQKQFQLKPPRGFKIRRLR